LKVLLDHNLPRQLKAPLGMHEVFAAREMRWDALSNGELIHAAEVEGFQVMVTGDQNLPTSKTLKRALSLSSF
jgi:hypothetical protein